MKALEIYRCQHSKWFTAKTSTSALPLPLGPPATAVGAPPELASTCPAMSKKENLQIERERERKSFSDKKAKKIETVWKNNKILKKATHCIPSIAESQASRRSCKHSCKHEWISAILRKHGTFTDLFTKLVAHLQMLTFDGTITACLTPWWSSSIGSNKLKGLLPTIDLWRTLQAKRTLDCACVLTGCLVSRLDSQGWDIWF